jgi:arylsulfatase
MKLFFDRLQLSLRCLVALAVLLATSTSSSAWQQPGSQLPQPDPVFDGVIGETYKQSKASFPLPVTAKPGSPNVLLILLDDVGFGMCSTFGGPVPTPYLDQLAAMAWFTTASTRRPFAAQLAGRCWQAATIIRSPPG